MAQGIWLEVADVRFDSAKGCQVRFKADKEDPRGWWEVMDDALGCKQPGLKVRQEIQSELDKKHTVLAELKWEAASTAPTCQGIRFLGVDAGSR